MQKINANTNLLQFSKQLMLIQEYIIFKFGYDFEEFCKRRDAEISKRSMSFQIQTGRKTKGREVVGNLKRGCPKNKGSTKRKSIGAEEKAPTSTSTTDHLDLPIFASPTNEAVSSNPASLMETEIKTEKEFFFEIGDESQESQEDDNGQGQGFTFGDDLNAESFRSSEDVSDFEECNDMENPENQKSTGPTSSKRMKLNTSSSAGNMKKDQPPVKAEQNIEWIGVCNPETVSRESILDGYVNNRKFRKPWEFPCESKYKKILEILKSERGQKLSGVDNFVKSNVFKHYVILIEGGQQVVAALATGKRLLQQEEFLSAFEDYHDAAGHPGRDATLKTLRSIYHYVPETLTREILRHCPICQNRCKRQTIDSSMRQTQLYENNAMLAIPPKHDNS